MTSSIDSRVAELLGDPVLAGYLAGDPAWVIWNAAVDRVIGSSSAAAGFRADAADPDGRVNEAFPLLKRLRALAGGLAPSSGVRLERVRTGSDLPDGLCVLACRLIDVDSEKALLTVLIDGAPQVAAQPSASVPLPRPGASANLSPGSADPPSTERIDGRLSDIAAQRDQHPSPAAKRRFIWSMGPDGRFTSVSKPLADVVGLIGADVLGRSWDELIEARVIDDGGGVAARLKDRVAWSGETALWRIRDSDRVVPVELGAMPMFDRERRFEGFRGFGLCDLDRITSSSDDRPAELLKGASESTASAPRQAAANAGPEAVDAGRDERAGYAEFGALAASVSAQLGSPRPVPLKATRVPDPASATANGESGSENVQSATSGVDGQKPHLSITEKGALQEIARALGAPDAPSSEQDSAGRNSAQILAMPARPRDAEVSRLLNRLPIGIVVVRGEAPVFANRFALDLLGYGSLPDFVGRGGMTRLFTGRMETRGKSLNGAPGVLTVVSRAGVDLAVEVKLTSVEWADGPASLLLVRPVPDASDAEESAASLRSVNLERDRLKERLREAGTALEVAQLATVTIDSSGRILSLNDVAEGMFGFTENEVAGEVYTTLLTPECHRRAIDVVSSAVRPSERLQAQGIEVFGLAASGRHFALSMRVGAVGGVSEAKNCLVLQDSSKALDVRSDLRAAHRAADAAVARQAEFLAYFDQGIRTPLNAITGFAEIIVEERFGPIGTERYKAYLRDIHASGRQILRLIDDFLQLSDASSGRVQLSLVELDLNAAVSGGVASAQSSALHRRVVPRTSLMPGIPRVVADERAVERIIVELIENAIAGTGAGGQVIVSTGLTEAGHPALWVRDSGVGMSPDEVTAALDPIRRTASTDQSREPRLRVAIAKALAEANGGSLAITSDRSTGTLVEVVFPPNPILPDSLSV